MKITIHRDAHRGQPRDPLHPNARVHVLPRIGEQVVVHEQGRKFRYEVTDVEHVAMPDGSSGGIHAPRVYVKLSEHAASESDEIERRCNGG